MSCNRLLKFKAVLKRYALKDNLSYDKSSNKLRLVICPGKGEIVYFGWAPIKRFINYLVYQIKGLRQQNPLIVDIEDEFES